MREFGSLEAWVLETYSCFQVRFKVSVTSLIRICVKRECNLMMHLLWYVSEGFLSQYLQNLLYRQ